MPTLEEIQSALLNLSGGRMFLSPAYSKSPPGMTDLGNINLANRPSINGSTVRSISFEDNGQEILVPTVVEGKIVSDDEAIENYYRTGKHLGKFSSPEEATNYASGLHNDYETGIIPVPSQMHSKLQSANDTPSLSSMELILPLTVRVSSGRAGALNFTESLPPESQLWPKAKVIISDT